MIVDLYSLLIGFARLRSSSSPRKWEIFLTYIRIRAKARWYLITGKKVCTETIFGFHVRFFDYATFAYLFEEIFIEATYLFHSETTSPRILDAGSNIGLSVLYFKWLYPNSTISAFEPDEQTFAVLKQNVEQNGFKNVTLHQVALSDQDGQATFHTDRDGSLGASLHEARNQTSSEQIVQTRSLAGFLKSDFDFMKMDIEGAEADCLADVAKQGRLSAIKEMVIECHHNLAGREQILSRILPMLEASGFFFQVHAAKAPMVSSSSPATCQDVMLHVYQKNATEG